MIKAHFYNKEKSVCGFNISGHAGYADSGEDIVCASVSSAVQMAANTVTEIIHLKATVSDEKGTISFMIDDFKDKNYSEAVKVLEGLRLHLTILSNQFQETIRIEDSEV